MGSSITYEELVDGIINLIDDNKRLKSKINELIKDLLTVCENPNAETTSNYIAKWYHEIENLNN